MITSEEKMREKFEAVYAAPSFIRFDGNKYSPVPLAVNEENMEIASVFNIRWEAWQAALQESEAGAVEPWKDDSVVWRLSQEFNKPAPWFDERMSSVAYHAAFEFNPGDAGSRNCFMAGARWMSGFLELVLDSSKELEANALTGSGLDGYAKELLQFHDEIEESECTTLDVQELNALTRLGWLDKTGLCAWELTDEGRYVVGIMDELRRMAESSMEGEK